jgi:hypothetical protein
MKDDEAENLSARWCQGVVVEACVVGGCYGAMIRLEFKPLSLRSSQRARMTDAYRALAVE